MAFLLADVSPNFIDLHIFHRQPYQLPIHQPLTPFPGQHQQFENGIAVNPCHALHAPNAHALQQQSEHVQSTIQRHAHLIERLRVVLCEGSAALRTAEPL